MHDMVVKNKLPLLIVAAALFAQGAQAADIAGPIEAEVERVVDGDTVRVSAKIWVDQRVSVSARFAGVDAPELFRPQCEAERVRAQEAKAFVERIVGAEVRLLEIEHDKYGGRVVARLFSSDGDDVGAALLESGLAVEMGARDPWCG